MSLRVPSRQTLRRYGLSEDEWAEMAGDQNGTCFICLKTPKNGVLHIDHAHVRGWKKMEPVERKLYVRALLCAFCNLRVASRATNLDKARRLVQMLEAHQLKLGRNAK